MKNYKITESADFRAGRYELREDGTVIAVSDSTKLLVAIAGRRINYEYMRKNETESATYG